MFKTDPKKAMLGATVFNQRCAICHGDGALSGGAAPSLLQSAIPLDIASFKSVLHDGILMERGMPRFEELREDEIIALQHYLRQRAREVVATNAPTKP